MCYANLHLAHVDAHADRELPVFGDGAGLIGVPETDNVSYAAIRIGVSFSPPGVNF